MNDTDHQLRFDTGYTTADVARKTYRTVDEKRYEREQRAKRWKPTPIEALLDGPCCGRCGNWNPPLEKTHRYGECSVVVLLSADTGKDHKKGQVFPIGMARTKGLYTYELVRTTAAFSCATGNICPVPGFVARQEIEEAAA